MKLEQRIVKLFLPDDDSWLKHANPWSVWTRFATLPFIILAIWSRVWIGWFCLIPLFLLIAWVILNPTLFSRPKTFENWGAKAVLGERTYTKRKATPLPEHHRIPIAILNILQAVSVVVLGYGLWALDIRVTLLGAISLYLTKMWFLDRMVWLYHDTSDTE